MDSQKYMMITLGLKFATIVISGIIVPFVISYIKVNTTSKQQENLKKWGKIAIFNAEKIFKDPGLGAKKKEYVIKYLKDCKLKFTEEQASGLIDTIVEAFNQTGWDVKDALEEVNTDEK